MRSVRFDSCGCFYFCLEMYVLHNHLMACSCFPFPNSVIIFYIMLRLYQTLSLALKYVVSKAAVVLTSLERRVPGERQTLTFCQVSPVSCSKRTSSTHCWAPVPGQQAPSGRSGKWPFASSRQEDRKFRASLVNS